MSVVSVYQPLDLATAVALSGLEAFPPGFGLFIAQKYGNFVAPTPGTSGKNQERFDLFFGQILGGSLSYGFLDQNNTKNAAATALALTVIDASQCNSVSGVVLYSNGGVDDQIGTIGDYEAACFTDGEFIGGYTPGITAEGPGAAIIGGNQCQSLVTQFEIDTSGGDHSVTGIGFQPDAIIVMGVFPFSGDGGGEFIGGLGALGACDADGNQWAWGTNTTFEGSDSDLWTIWRDDAFIAQPGQGSGDLHCSIVSMDSDGFTYSTDAAGAGPYYVHILAVKVTSGAGIAVGVGTQDDTTLTCGFEPAAMMFATGAATSNGTASGTTRGSMGMCGVDASSDFGQYSMWAQNECGYIDVAASLVVADETPTVFMELSAALTGTGANLTWPTTDSGGRKFGWVAFNVDNVEEGAPPVADTGSATPTTTTAVVDGDVTPNNTSAVSYRFDYGTTTAYGHSTTPTVAGTGSSAIPVDATITGLTAVTTYHYRVVAILGDCEIDGDDMTFRTGAPPNRPFFNNSMRASNVPT